MTEETTVNTDAVQGETAQPDANNVNISVEAILASILKNMGQVKVPVADLIADYTGKQIAVNQLDENTIAFDLVDIPVVESAPEASE